MRNVTSLLIASLTVGCALDSTEPALSGGHALLRKEPIDDIEPIEVGTKPPPKKPIPPIVDPPIVVAPAEPEASIVYPPTTILPVAERDEACSLRSLIAEVRASSCPGLRVKATKKGQDASVAKAAAEASWTITTHELRPTIVAGLPRIRPTRLCAYTAPEGVALNKAVLPTGVNLHPNCGSVVAQSEVDDVAESILPRVEQDYRKFMSALDREGEPLALPKLASPAQLVEVALIDSSLTVEEPQLYPPTGPWIHGRAMGLAIHRLACPDGGASARSECVVRFTSQQVLTEASNWGPTEGGTEQWGYLSRLGQAIDSAVEGFVSRRGIVGMPQRLIINVSLGYDGDWARTSSGLNPPSEALAAALHRASCAGALVIAAAGNTGYGIRADQGAGADPMYPAAFMPEHNVACPGGVGERLVYAASALDERDMHVQNMRFNGISELAAYGSGVSFDNTTSPDDPSAPPIPRMTGSSFAAAGTSAVAAVVWSYLPHLKPRQVMDLIGSTSVMLGWQASSTMSDGRAFCFTEACASQEASEQARTTRRITLCNALEASLEQRCRAGQTDACSAQVALDRCAGITHRAYTGRYDAYDLTLLQTLGHQHEIPISFPKPISVPAPCKENDHYQYRYYPAHTTFSNQSVHAPENGTLWCPSNTRENNVARPYALETSPGEEGCRSCAIAMRTSTNDPYFYAGLDSSLQNRIVTSTLSVAGNRYVLGNVLNQATTGNVVAIKLLPEAMTHPLPADAQAWNHQATLEHVLTSGNTSVSTVPIHYN